MQLIGTFMDCDQVMQNDGQVWEIMSRFALGHGLRFVKKKILMLPPMSFEKKNFKINFTKLYFFKFFSNYI